MTPHEYRTLDHGAEPSFGPALPEDDPRLRALLRRTALGRRILITLEREPSFFAAEGAWDGPTRTGVLRAGPAGRPVGLICRSTALVHLGGETRRVGFVHSARLPGRGSYGAAGAFLRSAHEPGDAPFDLFALPAEESATRDLLLRIGTERGALRSVGTVIVFLVSVRAIDLRHVTPVTGTAGAADLPALLRCLERNGRRAALAPAWSEADLVGPSRRKELELSDLCFQPADGEVRGCIGVWDQTSFKQTVIRAYRHANPCWTLVGKRADDRRTYQLPAEGSRLRNGVISHLAVDADDPELFRSLFAAACVDARRRRLDHVSLVLGANDPFVPVLRDLVPAWELPVELFAIREGDDGKGLESLRDGLLRPGALFL